LYSIKIAKIAKRTSKKIVIFHNTYFLFALIETTANPPIIAPKTANEMVEVPN
jgi:hypothetical protein